MTTTFTLNGQPVSVDAEGNSPLLWVIRDTLDLKGTKFGCGVAACDACIMHINGVVLPRFSSGVFRAMFAMEETRNGNEIHRRVSA